MKMTTRARESLCKGCGKPIRWIKTVEGKKMPVDAEPVWVMPDPDGKIYIRKNGGIIKGLIIGDACDTPDRKPAEAYVSHFATCTKAADFRKERRG